MAILDAEKGAQPFLYDDMAVVFNGEIFNYKELREDLKSKGYHFKTNCDTEILIPLYEEYGTAMLDLLDGQFAFCISDGRKMFIARDPFGIIPLFYTQKPLPFAFSSEIKPLVDLFYPKINGELYPTFLKYRYIPDHRTLYKNIFSLLPGYYMKVRCNLYKKPSIKKYFTLKIPEINNNNIKENIEKLRQLLNKVVYERTMADVPIGTFLSGGLDSTIITGLIKNPIKTFSVGFADDNEFKYAKLAANHFNLDNEQAIINKSEFIRLFKNYIKNKRYPLSVPNEVFIKELAEYVKKSGIKVLLSGEGADEIFCGYDRLFRIALNEGFEKAIESYGYFSDEELEKIFGKKPIKLHIEKEGTDIQTFSKFLIQYHLPCLLQRLDYAAMQHSIEPRPPFVSKRIIDFALSLPDKQKIDQKDSKIILKKTFKDIIPHSILNRPKIGFPININVYMQLSKTFPKMKEFKDNSLKAMFLYNLLLWEKNYEKFYSSRN